MTHVDLLIVAGLTALNLAAFNATALAESKANRQAPAESLGYQCRAAVRAELKGPDCRMPLPPDATSHCNIPNNADVETMDNKVIACIKQGGPGRQSKAGS
jgi:hypothetical protein